MPITERETLRGLSEKGLISMGFTGQWQISRSGRALLAELALLQKLAAPVVARPPRDDVREQTRGGGQQRKPSRRK